MPKPIYNPKMDFNQKIKDKVEGFFQSTPKAQAAPAKPKADTSIAGMVNKAGAEAMEKRRALSKDIYKYGK